MRIAIGNDHAAVELKLIIKEHLEAKGHEVINMGPDTTESVDYPAIGESVGRAIVAGDVDCGVLICGTGVGISIAANKVRGARAAPSQSRPPQGRRKQSKRCSCMRMQRAVHSKTFQDAQQLQYHRIRCKSCRQRDGEDDHRYMA